MKLVWQCNKRFSAIAENHFMYMDELDAISPHKLNPCVKLSNETVSHINAFGIDRQFHINYLCHWKDKLMQSRVIEPNSLMFQEDDAMIYSILHYPNPVKDWSIWSTITFYSMKLYTSISGSALSLYRGVTKLRSTQC